MKRKTFAKLRTAALGMLLLEAMLLLVLMLSRTGASAQDSGNFGAPGKVSGFGDTSSGSDGPDASGHNGGLRFGGQSPYLCGARNASCLAGGDAADIFDAHGGGGQDFTGSGKNGGGNSSNGDGGNGGPAQDFAHGESPPFGFSPGGAYGGNGGGGTSGAGNSHSDGQSPDGQNAGQNNGQDDGSKDGDDAKDANPPVISDFISPDAGDNAAGDPPPTGAGDPPAISNPDAPTPVPEPMTGSLLAAGVAAMLILRRRRR